MLAIFSTGSYENMVQFLFFSIMTPTIGIVYKKSLLNKVHKIFLIYFLLGVLLFSSFFSFFFFI